MILADGRNVFIFEGELFRVICECTVAVARQSLPRPYPYRPAAILINRIDVIGSEAVRLGKGADDSSCQAGQPTGRPEPDIAFTILVNGVYGIARKPVSSRDSDEA